MFTVSDIMSSPVFSLSKMDSMFDVRELMSMANIRHIPVTDEKGNFEGLVTHRDLLVHTVSKLADISAKEQNELEKGIVIREIMRTDVCCISPDKSLKEAASILYKHKYGCLPVTASDKLVGILTEADFLRLTISLLENIDS